MSIYRRGSQSQHEVLTGRVEGKPAQEASAVVHKKPARHMPHQPLHRGQPKKPHLCPHSGGADLTPAARG